MRFSSLMACLGRHAYVLTEFVRGEEHFIPPKTETHIRIAEGIQQKDWSKISAAAGHPSVFDALTQHALEATDYEHWLQTLHEAPAFEALGTLMSSTFKELSQAIHPDAWCTQNPVALKDSKDIELARRCISEYERRLGLKSHSISSAFDFAEDHFFTHYTVCCKQLHMFAQIVSTLRVFHNDFPTALLSAVYCALNELCLDLDKCSPGVIQTVEKQFNVLRSLISRVTLSEVFMHKRIEAFEQAALHWLSKQPTLFSAKNDADLRVIHEKHLVNALRNELSSRLALPCIEDPHAQSDHVGMLIAIPGSMRLINRLYDVSNPWFVARQIARQCLDELRACAAGSERDYHLLRNDIEAVALRHHVRVGQLDSWLIEQDGVFALQADESLLALTLFEEVFPMLEPALGQSKLRSTLYTQVLLDEHHHSLGTLKAVRVNDEQGDDWLAWVELGKSPLGIERQTLREFHFEHLLRHINTEPPDENLLNALSARCAKTERLFHH